MQELDDIGLLRRYVDGDSEEAFAGLVTRHINKVYSVALRHTRNPHQAEEITQAVFVILAKKARGLGCNVILSGWLYQTAHLTSVTFLRSEIRRARREQEASMQNALDEPAVDETWRQIAPLLDAAMAGLNETDRHAVVLRFFDGKSMSEVGAALGATEEAAKKRVGRALEKLQRFFTKHGVNSTTAIIAGTISSNSVQVAPAGLANTVTVAAIAKGASASASTVTMVNGILKAMLWAKAQTTVLVGVGILLAAGTTTVIVKTSAQPSPAALPPIPSGPQVITLDDGTKLTLLGTTYGTRHFPPHFKGTRGANMIYTGKFAAMVVWIQAEHKPGNWPSYELFVYDASNTACVPVESTSSSRISPGVDDMGFVLRAFPRWDKELLLRVAPYRQPMAKGEFLIANRDVRSPPAWTPETLPATNSDGDLQVTLTRLVAGVPEPYWQNRKPTPTNDLSLQGVHLNFDFTQNGKPATNWFPWLVWTTDAVSNQVDSAMNWYPPNGIYPYPPNNKYDGYFYKPGLWPDEPWKVRLEFTQNSGFSDDEIVTFTNIPVKAGTQQDYDDEWTAWDIGKTNVPFTITPATVNGVHLKLLPPLIMAGNNSPPAPNISVIIGTDVKFPERQGYRITILEAKDDQGHDLWHLFNPDWAGSQGSLEFVRVGTVKTLTMKLALHKSRFVEFTVQPTRQ